MSKAIDAVFATILFVFAVVILGVTGWTLGVFHRVANPNAAVTKYEWFFDAEAEYNSRVASIKVIKELQASNPDDKNYATDLIGLRLSCIDLANRYNTNSVKRTTVLFKDNGEKLPLMLDVNSCN